MDWWTVAFLPYERSTLIKWLLLQNWHVNRNQGERGIITFTNNDAASLEEFYPFALITIGL